MPTISNLVKKKKDYYTKISEIEKKITNHDHDKYIITSRTFFCKISARKFSNEDRF